MAARRTFSGCPDQVRTVRRYVQTVLGGIPATDTAVLLVSELATNAVCHTNSGTRGGGSFEVAILRTGSAVRIEVRDGGACQEPLAQQTSEGEETGRGLELVIALATRWGWAGGPGGRRVWFELSQTAESTGACDAA